MNPIILFWKNLQGFSNWFQGANVAKLEFIVDDYDEVDDTIDESENVTKDADVDDEVEKEDDLFDSVCVLCDNGGNILWYEFPLKIKCLCSLYISVSLLFIYFYVSLFSDNGFSNCKFSCDGICMRSFHATVDDDDNCDSLGLTQEEVDVCAHIYISIFLNFSYFLVLSNLCLSWIKFCRTYKVLYAQIVNIVSINALYAAS